MTTQSPNNGATNQPPIPPMDLSPREQRRAERHLRHAERWGAGGGAWFGGAILILIGMLLLLQNIGALTAENWWALFILIPAVGSFGSAWSMYQRGDPMSYGMISSFIAGLFFTGLAFALYFNINVTWVGPIALILIGIGVLAAALFRPTSQ